MSKAEFGKIEQAVLYAIGMALFSDKGVTEAAEELKAALLTYGHEEALKSLRSFSYKAQYKDVLERQVLHEAMICLTLLRRIESVTSLELHVQYKQLGRYKPHL